MIKTSLILDKNEASLKIKFILEKKIKFLPIIKSNFIVVIGGDGFMLQTLKKFYKFKKPFYGINSGDYGFLMNKFSEKNTVKNLNKAKIISIYPLEMLVKNKFGKIKKSIAINEISILRKSKQAASIKIYNAKSTIIEKLISDGVLVSTPAGSTAYNLSAHGSIIPLDSNLLALTPISAFRPRRWRGALLSEKTKINLEVTSSDSRPASITADHNEFRDITKAEIHSSNKNSCVILFDNKQSMEERILKEQFYS